MWGGTVAGTRIRDDGDLGWQSSQNNRSSRQGRQPDSGRHCRTARAAGSLAVCALLGAIACAPKQLIPLDVSPISTSVYLDGEQLDTLPRELKLRSDRDHMLFFKSEGHRAELIVLRSSLRDGKPRLDPARVQLRLAPLDPIRRELRIEQASERDESVSSESSVPSSPNAVQPRRRVDE